ncbi:SpoVK/Ycf46/Vps4 family AAA+-type ATPase [Natronospira proteinivora]|uniref:SpoVK/Ycf46/Vps4 family AAA+-type ATPase n=1 Tax=Natronospira proteinivora TaxID=1807133 RepID=A0ABT1G8H8_9GAMM|nr:ATP-binding protein [Natronospira proteinivora]MCP1727599.1 SpoVK/Ycf46/Vps4 family AAA+-type ATPase [Natronospira proteinivora]
MLKVEYAPIQSATTPRLSASEWMAAVWAVRLMLAAVPFSSGMMGRPSLGLQAARMTGIEEGLDLSQSECREPLAEAHERLLADPVSSPDEPLRNLHLLAECLGLCEAEEVVLAVGVFYEMYDWFEDVVDDALRCGNVRSAGHMISACTGLSRQVVKQAMDPAGPLYRSGLMQTNRRGATPGLATMPGLDERLWQPQSDAMELFRHRVTPGRVAELGLDDFGHMSEQVALLRDYLAKAHAAKGRNVLLHGPPGVGKTELARALGQVLGFETFEVADESRPGEPMSASERFASFELAQTALRSSGRGLILFDEIEDVFGRDLPMFAMGRKEEHSKAWVNRLLESNPVPAVWISNSIRMLDPAHLRRFDLVMEVKAPPQEHRERILRRYFRGMGVDGGWLKSVAARRDVSPAIAERAARVARTVAADDPQRARAVAEQVLTGQRGDRAKHKLRPAKPPKDFDMQCLNTRPGVSELLRLMRGGQGGRLCFCGPPGTGKTALAQYLAYRLGRPVLVKRASDLLGKYVGENEKNLANAFEQARRQKAVLVMDEVDSFLRSRAGAQAGWEVSQVNELLTQMEAFEGWFVATTNYMEALDTAALRRFDVKVSFDYLHRQQAERLFRRTLGGRRGPLSRSISERLARLRQLTPGDFAVAQRQAGLFGRALTADSLMAVLEREVAHKPGAQATGIGFLATVE